jgi:hypothetical protein
MFTAILIFISAIDMYVLEQSFWTSFSYLFIFDKGTNEGYINFVAAAGFIYSVAIDYRLRKNKGTKQS